MHTPSCCTTFNVAVLRILETIPCVPVTHHVFSSYNASKSLRLEFSCVAPASSRSNKVDK